MRIEQPALWLAADQVGQAVADGTVVDRWRNLVQTEHDFTRVSGTMPWKSGTPTPAASHGGARPSVDPNNSGYWRTLGATSWLDNPAGLTIFVVHRSGGGATGCIVAKENNTSSGPGWSVYGNGTSFLTCQSGTIYQIWTLGTTLTDNTLRVLAWRAPTRNTPSGYVNGVLSGSRAGAGTVTTTSSVTSVTVGAVDNGGLLATGMSIFEMAVWPISLSDAAMNYVGRALCAKYADSHLGTAAPRWTDL